MKRDDLQTWDSEEIREEKEVENSTYILKDDVMSFIDEIESRVNDFVKELDSIDSITELYKLETIRDDLKEFGEELY